MVKKYVKNQIHKDQIRYVSGVFNSGGLIPVGIQIAINRFIKFHYSKGLRDNTNLNHVIRHCSIYPTISKVGSNRNLWFIDNKETHFSGSDNNYQYTKGRGVTLLSNGRIDLDVAPSSLSSRDLSIGYYFTRITENTGYLGSVSGTFPNDTRMFMHPQFTGSRGVYFDVGDVQTTRRTVGVISPIDGDKNNKGLTICTKLDNVGLIQCRDFLQATASNLAVNPPVPNIFLEHYTGIQLIDRLDIGGYWYGKNINQSLFQNLVDEWNILQTSIDSSRSPTANLSPDNFPGLEGWYDAKDSSTLTFAATNQVSGWADKSGRENNLISQITGRTATYNGSNSLNMIGAQGATAMRRENSCYWGCIGMVFTPSVSANNGSTNNNNLIGFFLGNTSANHTGIALGSSTSFLTNEVISVGFEHSERVGYTTAGFTFSANSRYVVLINRRSPTLFDIIINGVSVPVTVTSNIAGVDTYVNNTVLVIGARYNNIRHFLGTFHEVVIYRNGLSQPDLNLLSNYLMQANGLL